MRNLKYASQPASQEFLDLHTKKNYLNAKKHHAWKDILETMSFLSRKKKGIFPTSEKRLTDDSKIKQTRKKSKKLMRNAWCKNRTISLHFVIFSLNDFSADYKYRSNKYIVIVYSHRCPPNVRMCLCVEKRKKEEKEKPKKQFHFHSSVWIVLCSISIAWMST